ncbi:lysylphosphatidylglycerol synthase transmembrane domain-containing protein [Actinoplanes ianthinogenes]|uniref:lysylphosphatidylglycerol synthase transmembrane domain-containing protein n=1 Tax=Actinoplanes ianthinogenes TaxID=122358 RepID=UPI00167181F0|nr:lysylphosphatidylglycerol synthase transmembrane domain-containing protein [Actinoplanes ianthinogenes]
MRNIGEGGRRWLLRSAALLTAAAAVGLTVRGHLPDPAAIGDILRTADWRWIVAALAAQVLSQAAFAMQQRRLLGAAGVTVTPGAALAITYSRSAISLALPAGSAMSAAYAVQQYRRRGATGTTAATVTLLSLLASMTGLLLVCALAFGPGAVVSWWHSASYEAVAAAVVLISALVTVARARPRTVQPAQPGPSRPLTGLDRSRSLVDLGSSRSVTDLDRSRSVTDLGSSRSVTDLGSSRSVTDLGSSRSVTGWPLLTRLRREWATAVVAARSIRPRDGLAALLWSALNWAADAFCLIAAAQACGLSASWPVVGAAYLVAQVVRQIPLSPGGLGFVEASLVTALSLGTTPTVAAAAVLTYRLFSFWLILPVGLLTYLGLRNAPARPHDFPATPASRRRELTSTR